MINEVGEWLHTRASPCGHQSFRCPRPFPGHVLQRSTPGQLHAFEGRDVTLPCAVGAPANLSQVTVVEWVKVDGPSPKTVHACRFGQELVQDHDADYLGRASILKNGSLKLVGVRQQDTGDYKCVTRSH